MMEDTYFFHFHPAKKIFDFVRLGAFSGPKRKQGIYLEKSGTVIFERLWTPKKANDQTGLNS